MKLVRYRYEKRESYGVLITNNVICLPSLAKRFNIEFPELMENFITLGAEGVEKTEKLLENTIENDIRKFSSPVNQVTLLSPIASPPKIVCLGLNYRDHAAEQGAAIPDEPIIFIKPHTTIIGPNENIVKPSFVKQLTMKRN